ncbi:MAG: hypothetical protein KF757_13930 [Phycisphaeraceae bacterium]|nr:hypothetical protein [Phycisphaeraceae bacterium]MCW5764061.1 hypothetical protein [Phycisphaeraceae bacterium]
MVRPVIILAAFLITMLPSLAFAQDRQFRAWFEAPETVLAGDTFQVWMWATYEVNGIPETVGNMDSALGSIEVSGDLVAFANVSQLLQGLFYFFERGTPDGPWLRDFAIGQPQVPGAIIDERNPLPILMFEIETTPDTTGLLHVNLRPYAEYLTAILYWRDPDLSSENWPNTLDPGISLSTSSATIRIIPAPASVIMLAFGSALTRRRR